jgi:hypothetical protein
MYWNQLVGSDARSLTGRALALAAGSTMPFPANRSMAMLHIELHTPGEDAFCDLLELVHVHPMGRLGLAVWNTLQRCIGVDRPRAVYCSHARMVVADATLQAKESRQLDPASCFFAAFTHCTWSNATSDVFIVQHNQKITGARKILLHFPWHTCGFCECLTLIHSAAWKPPPTVAHFLYQREPGEEI